MNCNRRAATPDEELASVPCPICGRVDLQRVHAAVVAELHERYTRMRRRALIWCGVAQAEIVIILGVIWWAK